MRNPLFGNQESRITRSYGSRADGLRHRNVDDILTWLREEERRLRDRVGAVHGDSPQYSVQALTNQADRIAEAAWEIERLRKELRAATSRGSDTHEKRTS